jgi:hypothetical protein
MSRIFGAVCQNGYVVRDIRAAMDHWVNVMGVGPWYYIDCVKTDYFRHRGRDSSIEMSVALANSGDLQIELIQQHCHIKLSHYPTEGAGPPRKGGT